MDPQLEHYLVHLTRISTNAKTGPIPVSTTSSNTCPPSCPFINESCYANQYPMKHHWSKVTEGLRGTDWSTFCRQIARLPKGILWRHNQAGDLPGDGLTIDADAMDELVEANRGKKGFTYTHYPMAGESDIEAHNRAVVADANARGFMINLSGDNLAHADHLAALEIAPVTTVLPTEQTETTYTPAGRKVIVCPATQDKETTCQTCQICQHARNAIVGFPAHGAQKAKASAIAEAA